MSEVHWFPGSRAAKCESRALEVGWKQACEEVYADVETTDAREYATRLRANGFLIDEIVEIVKLKFGRGSRESVIRWTTPGYSDKKLAANREWKKRTNYHQRPDVKKGKRKHDKRTNERRKG
jgi:hypothetical protein